MAVLDALRQYERYQEEDRDTCKFLTLLRRVIRRRLWNLGRTHRRAERHYDRRRDAAAALEGSGDRRRPDTETDPAVQILHEEDLARLRQALARLPEPARRALEGKYLEGKTLDQLAAELGVSIFRVWKLQQEARGLLRAKLPDLADEDTR